MNMPHSKSVRNAMLFERLADKRVRCNLCSRKCNIPNGQIGFCRVRRNIEGTLETLVYAKACSAIADRIEKKPLWHFNPGSLVFSIATVGCDFRCKFCQNWQISQEERITGIDLPPQDVVNMAFQWGCQGISYTYTEPTIFFEYAYDTAKLAHERQLFNTFVTNGYMTPEAVQQIAPYLDAVTVDFKGAGDPEFYRKFSMVPTVEPVYQCLKEMNRHSIHLEITNLVVPRVGDSLDRISQLAKWIIENLGENTPLHILRFHPEHKLTDIPSTPLETLEKAYKTCSDSGLKYVYLGNIRRHRYVNTYCPSCKRPLIERSGLQILKWHIRDDKTCPFCSEKIPIKGKIWISRHENTFI